MTYSVLVLDPSPAMTQTVVAEHSDYRSAVVTAHAFAREMGRPASVKLGLDCLHSVSADGRFEDRVQGSGIPATGNADAWSRLKLNAELSLSNPELGHCVAAGVEQLADGELLDLHQAEGRSSDDADRLLASMAGREVARRIARNVWTLGD